LHFLLLFTAMAQAMALPGSIGRTDTGDETLRADTPRPFRAGILFV
jgi:hypothetical protein